MKFIKHLPNFLTICNALLGCFALFFLFIESFGYSNSEKYHCIILLIFIAAIFDFLDGFFAKFLNVKSNLGSQLDSFSDLISFAVVPAFLLIYYLSVHEFSLYVKLTPLIIILSSIYRLSKFNLLESSNHFKGLPTPANAMFFLGLPSLLLYLNEFVLISIVLVFSFLMISDFKFYSFKSLKNKDEKQFLFVLILLQLVIIIFSFVYDVGLPSLLSFMILAYILSCFIISGINKEASSY